METHISLPAELVVSIFGIGITNAQLTALLLTAAFFVFVLWVKKGMGIIPSKIQVLFEALYTYILEQLENAFGSKEKALKFLPFYMTMLLFMLVANQMAILPIIFQVMAGDAPLLRLPTSDLAMTSSFALFVSVFANILAFKIAPLQHLSKYINIKGFLHIKKPGDIPMAFLDFFLGFMDIISEFAKILSLSFRLFGNIFAGEVMVAVIVILSAFTMFLVPMPFIILSVFSWLIPRHPRGVAWIRV